MSFHSADCKWLLSQMTDQENQLSEKRRWLMGLPAYNDKEPKFLKDRFIPESFLRKDDLFWDSVNAHVDNQPDPKRQRIIPREDDLHSFSSEELIRGVISVLDDLDNRSLCRLTETLSPSTEFKKTRKHMRKLIKDSIVSSDIAIRAIKVLNNETAACPDMVWRILDLLERLPFQALDAMRRKLKGDRADPLRSVLARSGLDRKKLISIVRKSFRSLLNGAGDSGVLPETLTGAVSVARLSLMLDGDSGFTEAELTDLQREIIRAVGLVNGKVLRVPELIRVQQALFPRDVSVSRRSLRGAIRKMLIQCLFESGEMEGDSVPEALSEALALIKHRKSRVSWSRGPFSAQDEVECILSVGAQLRQILWREDRCKRLAEDFHDAYVATDDDDSGFSSVGEAGPPCGGGCNEYLQLQEACDRVSVLAHGIVGRSLQLFASVELEPYAGGASDSGFQEFNVADDVLGSTVPLHAVRDVISLFSERGKNGMKKLLGLT